MGLKTFTISGAREASELICDSHSHGDSATITWIDRGSLSGNSSLATTIGWKEAHHNGASSWLCPQCSDKRANDHEDSFVRVAENRTTVEVVSPPGRRKYIKMRLDLTKKVNAAASPLKGRTPQNAKSPRLSLEWQARQNHRGNGN